MKDQLRSLSTSTRICCVVEKSAFMSCTRGSLSVNERICLEAWTLPLGRGSRQPLGREENGSDTQTIPR